MQFSDRISSLQPSAIREIFKVLQDPSIISFAGGNPAPESFPIHEMSRISAQIFEEQAVTALQYSVTEGYPTLRKQVETRLQEKFNIDTKNNETVIVTGGQQAIELTCKVLCNEGDVVICEEPSFIGALNAFRSYNTRLIGIPMQSDGMNLNILEHILKTEKKIKLLYMISTFQNPTGITTSLAKRQGIYHLAKKYGIIIFEDNPYGELRFSGENIATLKSMDTEHIVLYSGSFSKILSPGMRIGFICAPPLFISKLVVAKQISDVHTNIFFQILTSEFLKQENLDKHITKIQEIYKQKNTAMLKKMDELFPKDVFYTRPEGGLFIWCDLGHHIDSDKFSKEVIKNHVAVVPGSAFMIDNSRKSSCIRINYSMPSIDQINIGIERLSQAINKIIGEHYAK